MKKLLSVADSRSFIAAIPTLVSAGTKSASSSAKQGAWCIFATMYGEIDWLDSSVHIGLGRGWDEMG